MIDFWTDGLVPILYSAVLCAVGCSLVWGPGHIARGVGVWLLLCAGRALLRS